MAREDTLKKLHFPVCPAMTSDSTPYFLKVAEEPRECAHIIRKILFQTEKASEVKPTVTCKISEDSDTENEEEI